MATDEEWTPEQRQNAKDALAYLTALYYRQPDDTTTADDVLKSLLEDSDLPSLLAGMTSVAHMLSLIGFRNSNILPSVTLRELGEIFTKGE
ncbi:hypothetical protein [Mycolicibacterium bacteremicum]|uniref:hypothetical protein n=1 Tax=Mycolicibacterium bacteremicum TaxID=564198 RepID=UPI0026EE985B|nr:hypothetical protein [Mycolicibacterium bacteremicum]